MIIESLHIQNIRSYTNEKIKFPAGSVLLEGDIGCGKSSILLAIDFALFGLRVGELSGAELLRHGTTQGSVTLKIRLGGCDVEISRTLERKNNAIMQSAGHAIVDGVRHDLTGFALRFFVFELLGYPANLLRKNKSLLFRYTVYTPQEQMKAILLISPDERTSIMRHVFGIDRYRRLRGNSAIVSRTLRRKMEWLSGLSEGLEEKEKQRTEMLAQDKEILDEVNSLQAKVKTAEQVLAEKKKGIEVLEKQKQEFVSAKAKIDVAASKKDMLEKQIAALQKESSVLAERQKEISGNEKDFSEKADKLKNEILMKNDLKTQAEHFEKEIRAIDSVMSENSARQKMSREILERVKSISQCPTCLQDVGESHKRAILGGEEIKISNFQKIFSKLEEEKKAIMEKLSETKKALEKIAESERELTGLLASEKEIKRIADDVAAKEKALLDSGKEKESLEKELAALKKDAEKNAKASELHEAAKKEFDVLDAELSLKKQALARLEQQQDDIKKSLESIELEIADKRHAEKELAKIKKLHSWLEDRFSPLMETIERHMMGRIHHDFNAMFRKWFEMLIEEEALSARVDATFTPIVEQSGFETEFNHLSGGEKTSVALAYRLALNHMINSLADNIKTKDLLILDEPTDGFSGEQLDKVRDVLRSLALRQIIIVSHEEKIESFVDNIIRIEKINGESRVAKAV